MLERFTFVVIGAAATGAIIGALVWRWRRAAAVTEREFRNVFAMTSKELQEAMISGLMARNKCYPQQAMRLAVRSGVTIAKSHARGGGRGRAGQFARQRRPVRQAIHEARGLVLNGKAVEQRHCTHWHLIRSPRRRDRAARAERVC